MIFKSYLKTVRVNSLIGTKFHVIYYVIKCLIKTSSAFCNNFTLYVVSIKPVYILFYNLTVILFYNLAVILFYNVATIFHGNISESGHFNVAAIL